MSASFVLPKVLLVATKNRGKAAEFTALFAPLGIEVRSLNDYPDVPEIVEDGDTFAANALIKARAVANRFGAAALADDSGLCVEGLGGEPGVRSARYAGEPSSDAANNAKLLRELAARGGQAAAAPAPGEPQLLSSARFVCALALVQPDASASPLEVEADCPGFILGEPRGEHGFGYDPLFYLPAYGKTMAELEPAAKNAVSHRGKALQLLLKRMRGNG